MSLRIDGLIKETEIMAKKRGEAGTRPEIKRLDELEPEFGIIIAKFRGEGYEPLKFAMAIEQMNAAILEAAGLILRPQFGLNAAALAENAGQQWWHFMVKDQGGFQRYDGVRPFAPYGFKTLERICLSRENLRDQFHRRVTVREPKDDRRNPNGSADGKAGVDRRQVPLDFDPVDQRSTTRAMRQQRLADAVQDVLYELPEDQREVLILRYLYGANLSQVARERGITASKLHMRLHYARHAFREGFGGFEW
jgi:RNA polymerase sigma factor (sigma-70 family)